MQWIAMIEFLIRTRACLAIAALLHASVPATVMAETPGKDGDQTVSASTVLNQYAALAGSPGAGAPSVSLASAIPGLARGDLVLIYQAQGAAIDTPDTAAYGAVSGVGSAGLWEFQTVASVSGLTVTFANYGGACGGLRNGYDAAGRPQMIRVPQYRNLTINGGATVSAQPWNGSTGGVAAIHVSQTLTNNGAISADGAGFRGGAVDNFTTGTNVNNTAWRAAGSTIGGEKGESIAGFQTDYDALGGRFWSRRAGQWRRRRQPHSGGRAFRHRPGGHTTARPITPLPPQPGQGQSLRRVSFNLPGNTGSV
ncbi:MAG: hypothetical protein HC788_13380, partial [Sphingopyxis sp.]|nr:hypothetical protein [Sphingopyxis sp.]